MQNKRAPQVNTVVPAIVFLLATFAVAMVPADQKPLASAARIARPPIALLHRHWPVSNECC